MPKKLAIVISGAVSLGSYEAGVMYEVIRAIGQHNLASPPDEQILIDVITGASAGGMTAAVLTQKLLYEADALDHPTENALHRAWVEQVDIKGLLRTDLADPPLASLLSSNEVGRIADGLLLSRYPNPAPAQSHPAAAPLIHLGLAMSNLNGLDYSVPTSNADDLCARPGDNQHFTYTRHQDSFIRSVDQGRDNPAFWGEVIVAARACGAFPMAFRPLDVLRNTGDPDEAALAAADNVGAGPQRFTYTDGGLFQNEPLGMAKGLVERIDTAPNAYLDRYYLYVSPDPKASAANRDFSEAGANLTDTAGTLVKALFNQARYQDWIRMRDINLAIDRFDQQAEWLAGVLQQDPQKLECFAVVSDTLLDNLYDGDNDARTADNTRLREQFDDIYPTLPEGVANIWLSSVQLLEKAAGLGSKDLMTVYTITAEPKETASELLFAFSGFMERRFRDHDYQLGRYKAQQFLRCMQAAGQTPGNGRAPMPLRNFTLQPVDKPHPDLSQATVGDIDEQNRRHLLERAQARVKLTINKQVKGFFKRLAAKALASPLVGSLLRHWLELKRRWWPPSAW